MGSSWIRNQTHVSCIGRRIPYHWAIREAHRCSSLLLCFISFSSGKLKDSFPVHHQLPELTQTDVHRVSDIIQLSHPLSSPSPPTLNLIQHQGLFQWVSSSHQVAKVLEFQLQHQSFQWIFRNDFLQDGLVGSPCNPRDSQESSPTQYKSISSELSFLYRPTLISVHDTLYSYM